VLSPVSISSGSVFLPQRKNPRMIRNNFLVEGVP
jgi:hypothetical protein